MALDSIGPIVVTGGSGFIGTHLVAALNEGGANVVNLDIKSPILDSHRFVWNPCDLMNRDEVCENILRVQPRVIYNLAARASLKGTADEMKVNFVGVSHLIDACRRLDHEPVFVQASTQLVAGAARDKFCDSAYEPYSIYGESKVRSEEILRSSGGQWVIVRPTNIWGPYHPTFEKGIWRYIRWGLYMHPSGLDAIRSYGYVGNVVHQLIRILEVDRREVTGRTFYVGDEPIPSTQWLDAFSSALIGRPVLRVPIALLRGAAWCGELSGRLGGPSPINIGRLHRMTGDFPVPMKATFSLLGAGPTSLAQGVRETVFWLNNKGKPYSICTNA